ncbi:hypothetical protein BDZ97DRAFT_1922784 [Flammula alnicola]|nr:hypothetical protein BDZ97DRAFT_1922784 [Flammula alnicola]
MTDVASESNEVQRLRQEVEQLRESLRLARLGAPVTFSPPISVLPVEVLLKIFFLLLDDKPRNVYKATNRSKVTRKDAVAASQICRLWREIALGSSAFWNEMLDCSRNPPLWFSLLLERSGSQGLSIIARHRTIREWEQPNLKAIMHMLDRVKSFELHIISYDFFPGPEDRSRYLNDVFEKRLPSLERLCLNRDIVVKPWMRYNGPRPDWPLFKHPEWMAPKLRVLELCHVAPNFDVPFYRNLSVLSVVDLEQEQACPHFTRWLEILRSMPNLIDLTIKNSVRVGTPTGPPPVGVHTRGKPQGQLMFNCP